MFIRDVRGSGHQIFSFAKMILRDSAAFRMTWHDFFVAAAILYFRQMEWKNCKTHWYEAVSSALNLPILQEVSQNASFLMLSTSKT